MDIKKWSENIVKEIYLEYKNKYFFWVHGIKIFYSPVVQNPKLLIISYQPGGTEKNFAEEEKNNFENEDFTLQTYNSYVTTNGKMARRVRDFFDFNGGLDLLKNSVVLPLIFFRSPSVREWRDKIPENTRIDMEQISLLKVKEIIDTLKPENILVVGISTYREIKLLLGNIENEMVLHSRKEGKENMVIVSRSKSINIFACTHLSGAIISNNDMMIMSTLFSKWINGQ